MFYIIYARCVYALSLIHAMELTVLHKCVEFSKSQPTNKKLGLTLARHSYKHKLQPS